MHHTPQRKKAPYKCPPPQNRIATNAAIPISKSHHQTNSKPKQYNRHKYHEDTNSWNIIRKKNSATIAHLLLWAALALLGAPGLLRVCAVVGAMHRPITIQFFFCNAMLCNAERDHHPPSTPLGCWAGFSWRGSGTARASASSRALCG